MEVLAVLQHDAAAVCPCPGVLRCAQLGALTFLGVLNQSARKTLPALRSLRGKLLDCCPLAVWGVAGYDQAGAHGPPELTLG